MENKLAILTEEVFEALVNKYPNYSIELVSYKLKELEEKIGLLGEHAELQAVINLKSKDQLTYSIQNVKLFAKFFPRDEQAHFARETGAFTKEIFVYNLFNKMQDFGVTKQMASISKCYLAKEEKVLVFDDLTELGFLRLDKNTFLDYNTVLIVLQSLARLHASTLVYEEKMSKQLGKTYRFIDEYEKSFEDTFFNDKEQFINKNGIEASLKCILTEIDLFDLNGVLESGKDFREVAKNTFHQIYKLVKPSEKYRNVVSHGDLWCTNFLIKYNKTKPIDCKFVDFQCARYIPPSHDVMSLLYLTTSREFRKKHLYELLGIYYANLEKNVKICGYNLADLVPFEDFLKSCEEQKLFAILQAVNYFQLILVDSKHLENIFKDKELYKKALMEDRSILMKSYIDKDENYRKRLEESMKDLRLYCEYL